MIVIMVVIIHVWYICMCVYMYVCNYACICVYMCAWYVHDMNATCVMMCMLMCCLHTYHVFTLYMLLLHGCTNHVILWWSCPYVWLVVILC